MSNSQVGRLLTLLRRYQDVASSHFGVASSAASSHFDLAASRASSHLDLAAHRASSHLGSHLAAFKIFLDQFFRRDNDPPALCFAIDSPGIIWQQQQQQQRQRLKPNKKSNPLEALAPLLDSIWWAVPKKKESPYVTRRRWWTLSPGSKRYNYGTPLLNVKHCLECDNLMYESCVCPHCYGKVRERTEKLKAKLGDDFKYRHPKKEVRFVYDNEFFGNEKDNHIVKLEGERPSWFSKALLPKKSR